MPIKKDIPNDRGRFQLYSAGPILTTMKSTSRESNPINHVSILRMIRANWLLRKLPSMDGDKMSTIQVRRHKCGRSCLHQSQLHNPSINTKQISALPNLSADIEVPYNSYCSRLHLNPPLKTNTSRYSKVRQLPLTTMAAKAIRSKLGACLDSLDHLVRLTKEPQYRYEAEIPATYGGISLLACAS